MNKILRGAKQALAIARGEKLPSKATKFGYSAWNSQSGLGNWIYPNHKIAEERAGPGDKIVRVKLETY